MISLIYGGITHHYLGSNLPYCNRINNVGTIHNEYIIAMAGTRETKLGIIKGKDSACGNIVGPISSFQISENVDFMLGWYNTNFKKFRSIGIEPPSYYGITPVIGFDYKIKITEKISIDNLISVGIITHAIRMDF